MANSITGINDDIISDGVLSGFTTTLAPLMAFATDFSPAPARRGEKVSILRDNTAIDAVQTKATHADYTIQDCDSDAVEVTLGQPKYVSWSLDDTEIAQSSVLNLEVYGRRKGNKLGVAILQDIWSEITNTNFGAAAFTGAASTFDSDDVADLKETCDLADWPLDGRYLFLSPAYYSELLKDAGIKDSSAFGGPEAIRNGDVPNLFGFGVIQSNAIPANGENLVGFAAHASAIAVAMRYLQPQEGNKYNRAEAMVDPETGFVLGLRDWYDEDSGVRKRLMEAVYGYETGISTAIKRMVSS